LTADRPADPGHAADRGLKLLIFLTRAGARVNRAAARGQTAFHHLAQGFLSQALSPAEMATATLALYDVESGSYETRRALTDWEREWYAASLPPAPARILVTAAGKGREVAALLHLGYSVDAFEPVAPYVEPCARLDGVGLVLTADYADFCRAVLDDGGGPAAALRDRTYDAVILGWGSLTHVLTPHDQHRVLAAASALTPHGPVLASFFVRKPAAVRPEGHVRRLGTAAGRLAGRLRRVPAAPVEIGFFWNLGFTYSYTSEDLERLSTALGRRSEWHPEPYGHATLLPPG
jgi:hypothetical protein